LCSGPATDRKKVARPSQWSGNTFASFVLCLPGNGKRLQRTRPPTGLALLLAARICADCDLALAHDFVHQVVFDFEIGHPVGWIGEIIAEYEEEGKGVVREQFPLFTKFLNWEESGYAVSDHFAQTRTMMSTGKELSVQETTFIYRVMEQISPLTKRRASNIRKNRKVEEQSCSQSAKGCLRWLPVLLLVALDSSQSHLRGFAKQVISSMLWSRGGACAQERNRG
jgi:hypothetical protein